MIGLIERLRKIADFVLVDLPPLLAVNDAKVLAKITDGVIFVVRWEEDIAASRLVRGENSARIPQRPASRARFWCAPTPRSINITRSDTTAYRRSRAITTVERGSDER